MSEKRYTEFYYSEREDYDKSLKINDEQLKVFSKKKLKDLYPDENYVIVGETFENKKRDKEKDIGRIELNEKRLNVGEAGKHNKIFKKQGAFVQVKGGGFIAILKTRILVIILIGALVLGAAGAGVFAIVNGAGKNDNPGGDIKPIDPVVLTISGIVSKDGKPVENATLSLQKGNNEIAAATTDKDGKYLINDVENGNYNLVCTNNNSILTKNASVWGDSVVVNFTFPANDLHDIEDITDHHNKEDLPDIEPTEDDSDVKAIVKITDENTPPVAVGGLSKEAMLNMIAGKEVDLTFLATMLLDDNVPSEHKLAIETISGELEMTYYDFSVLKEIFANGVLEETTNVYKTKTVLEVAVPFDSTRSVGTYAFRYHDGEATMLEKLDTKPDGDFKDGTYYVANDTVYVYTNLFSTYAIGAAYTENVVHGSDTITYSGNATIDLNTNKITCLYKHDADSTNDSKIQIYLVGDSGNMLIAESDTIPVGYQIESIGIKSDVVKKLPSVGTYQGIMKIIYLESNGDTSTNVDIPLTVAVVK